MKNPLSAVHKTVLMTICILLARLPKFQSTVEKCQHLAEETARGWQKAEKPKIPAG